MGDFHFLDCSADNYLILENKKGTGEDGVICQFKGVNDFFSPVRLIHKITCSRIFSSNLQFYIIEIF